MPQPSADHRWIRVMLLVAVAYVAIAAVTQYGMQATPRSQWRLGWRWAAWLVSMVVFAWHIIAERGRPGIRARTIAAHAASAVALATLVLAVTGPVRTHWGAATAMRVALLSVVLWPVLAGGAAFLAAFAAGSLRTRHP